MIEILGLIYLSSFVLSLCLLFWQYLFICRQLDSVQLQSLNANLEKVGLFWANAKSDFARLDADSIEADRLQSKRSLLFIGLLAFGSLLGLILLILVILSLRRLARPRREVMVFRSELVTQSDLPLEAVIKLVDQLQKIP